MGGRLLLLTTHHPPTEDPPYTPPAIVATQIQVTDTGDMAWGVTAATADTDHPRMDIPAIETAEFQSVLDREWVMVGTETQVSVALASPVTDMVGEPS